VSRFSRAGWPNRNALGGFLFDVVGRMRLDVEKIASVPHSRLGFNHLQSPSSKKNLSRAMVAAERA
jgi:hypothetical protein